MNLNEMITIDLPSLQSIQIGFLGLSGNIKNQNCSLTLKSTNEMI